MYNYIAIHVKAGTNGSLATAMYPFTCAHRDLAEVDDSGIRSDVAQALGIVYDGDSPTEGVFIYPATTAADEIPEVIL